MRTLHSKMAGLILSFLLAAAANGQSLTGQISGTVQDPSGTAVPGVKIELRNSATGQVRDLTSDNLGYYRVPDLLPGRYDLSASAPGFKKFEQKDIVLTATERLVVRPIVLELGQLTETVTITAQGARVQAQSAERSGLLTTEQVLDAPIIGRNIFTLLKTLPGVVDTGATLQAPADWDNGGKYINGGRANTLSERLDGISSHDTGNWGGPQFTPNLESIAEVKVLLSNYQAEYGHNMGGSMNTVTKSGSKELHGGAYYFKRNEAFNSNDYFNNLYNVKRPRYRYDYPGYFLGGPVIIPGLIKSREKLFFFWSQEFCPRTLPSSISRYTVPSALERSGDFSQTVDTNGKLIPVNDPLNNKQPFGGNVIPSSRLDPNGKKILSAVFPLPNTTDPNHTFNELITYNTDQPHHSEILRVDWNLGPKNVFYARGLYGDDSDKGKLNASVVGNIFPGLGGQYHRWSKGLVATFIHTFSPTLVNELTFGINRRDQLVSALSQETLDQSNRTKLGLNLPQFHPEINPNNLLPNMSFGGVQNAPSVSYESRFPFFGTNSIWNVIDNVSKVSGSHNLKAGFFFERVSRNAARGSTFNGSFSFGRDTYNPYDTNYAFSNAILGSIASYSESDAHLSGHARDRDIEWFIQDNWRVTKRFTIDVGIRFYNIVPTWGADDIFGRFDRSLWDPAKAPQLVQPYKDASGQRVAIDPVTGQILPAVKIGTFASGSGNIYNGLQVYKEHLLNNPGFLITPRFGFAWDVFGNGKTAIRGGFGIFPGRLAGDDDVIVFRDYPPVVNTSTANYTTINDLLSTPLSMSPANVNSIQRDFKWPATYNWSFGIQRDIGHGTVLDVAYVGSVARHLEHNNSLNSTAYGTNFLPSSQDPTLPGTPLPVNFLRPMRGYGNVNYTEFASSSNYHSMQTQVNRRFARGLLFGASWTWSKSMDLVDGNSTLNPFLNPHMRHYGKAGFDRTHSFSFTYSYQLPKLSGLANNAIMRTVGDHWQISGVTSFQSGAPLGLSYSLVSGADITGASGSGIDSRVILTGNPVLPKGERSFLRFFNTSVVQPPLSNFGIGNAPKDPIRGPGINNWDIAILKDFSLGKDARRRLQFRCETYNSFNHAQFSGVNTSARFDASNNQVNNLFGTLTSTRDPRRMQLGLKFYF